MSIHGLALCLTALSAVLLAQHAAAGTSDPADQGKALLRDPPALLALSLDDPQASSRCLLLPEPRGSCGGWDLTSFRERVASHTDADSVLVGAGVVAFEEYSVTVFVSRLPTPFKNATLARLDAYLSAMRRALTSTPGTTVVDGPRRTLVGAYEGARVAFQRPSEAGPVTSAAVVLFAAESAHQLSFVSLDGSYDQLEAFVDRTLATVQYQPGDLGLFGGSWSLFAEKTGTALLRTVPGLAAIGLIAWAVRRRLRLR